MNVDGNGRNCIHGCIAASENHAHFLLNNEIKATHKVIVPGCFIIDQFREELRVNLLCFEV